MPYFKALLFFTLTFISLQLHAGKLADFEKDIKSSKSASHSNSNYYCRKCSSHDESFFDALFEGIVNSIFEVATIAIEDGSKTSAERIKKHPEKKGISPRKEGEIIIPFYRLNINYQYVDDKIDALDLKMEVGKGANGLELRITTYNDNQNSEELKYSQFQYFHRMSFGNNIGINLGLGYGRMDITDTFDGLLLSLPILYQSGRHLGIEVRPTYFNADGVDISELDFSVMYTYRKMAFRLGHRNIQSTNIDINGIYFGLDFIF